MTETLTLYQYLVQMRPDIINIVKPEYQNYRNWTSPSTFLKFGHSYKINKIYKNEVWILDDYDVHLYVGHKKLHHPGIVLHFTKIEFDRSWRGFNDDEYDEKWITPQECYQLMMEDVTKEVKQVELGTHKYKVQWFWHPEHFKKDSDSWRDAMAIEFHYSKTKGMYYDDAPNRFFCNIYYKNGQYDEETDEMICPSGWNNLRLGADNTCWCIDIGCSSKTGFGDGRYQGRFTLREAKKQYLGLRSLNELKPIFTELPPFTDEYLEVDLTKFEKK